MGVYEQVTIAAGLSSMASFDKYVVSGLPSDIEVAAIMNTKKLIELDQRDVVFDAVEREIKRNNFSSVEYWAGKNNLNNSGYIYKDPITSEFMKTFIRPPRKEYDFTTLFKQKSLDKPSVTFIENVIDTIYGYDITSYGNVKISWSGVTTVQYYSYEPLVYEEKVPWYDFIREIIRRTLVDRDESCESYRLDRKKREIHVDGSIVSFEYVNDYIVLKKVVRASHSSISVLDRAKSVRTLLEIVRQINTINKGYLSMANALDFIMNILFDKENYREYLSSVVFTMPTIPISEAIPIVFSNTTGRYNIKATYIVADPSISDVIVIASINDRYVTEELQTAWDNYVCGYPEEPVVKTTLHELAMKIVSDTGVYPVYIDFRYYSKSTIYVTSKLDYMETYNRVLGYIPDTERVMFPFLSITDLD